MAGRLGVTSTIGSRVISGGANFTTITGTASRWRNADGREADSAGFFHSGWVLPSRELPAGTITLMFADIEGSTALARILGDHQRPVDEPWGVRRLFVRDPHGVVISVLAHE
jgi:hypothetical protein